MTTERGTVLIVDDDPAVRLSVSALLEEDFDAVTAASAAEAEAALSRRSFDVVLTDFEMPGGSGTELVARLTAKYPDVIAILVTGHATESEVVSAENENAVVRVLAKPYDPKRLLKWVENGVRLARMKRTVSSMAQRPPLKSAT